VYLAIGGSLLGFTLFFYVLKKLSPSAVSLITLMTPVLAMMVGVLAAGEHITPAMMIGGGLVLFALVVYVEWSFGHCFEQALRRPAQHDAVLTEIKEQVIRYK
jgi:probable blue pigment (indigoidine) exporter